MTSVLREPSRTRLQRLGKRDVLVTEMSASLAIGVMWMAASWTPSSDPTS
jgi:hypothetical protein